MAPRFTVIQGGQSGQATPAAGWPVGSCRPGRADAALAQRVSRVGTVVADALPRASGRGAAVALAWIRDAETERGELHGVVPPAAARPVLSLCHDAFSGAEPAPRPVERAPAGAWQAADAEAVALVQRAAAEAVDRALRMRCSAPQRTLRLVGAAEPVRARVPPRPAPAANRSARTRSVPALDLIGIRPTGWVAPDVAIGPEPDAVGGAGTARRPAIADPPVASLARMVSRLFERCGAWRVAFLRRAGEIVGACRRGAGSAVPPGRRPRA